MSNHPTNKAEQLKLEYAAFGAESPTRSPERQRQLDDAIAKLCAQGDSGNVINLVTQYNFEDGFYDKYPLILEQLVNNGKITKEVLTSRP